MSWFGDNALGLLDGIGGLFQTGYSVYQDQRNFKYEKALQQQVFDREDSAYQRAVADAQKAGLSKGVVSSGAGSGAVLGASSTQVGNPFENLQQRKMNALSMKQQAMDYSMSETQKNILEYQESIARSEAMQKALDSNMSYVDALTSPGILGIKFGNKDISKIIFDEDVLKDIRQKKYEAELAKYKSTITSGQWAESNQVLDRIMQLLGLGVQVLK